jgi:hypothetical protein
MWENSMLISSSPELLLEDGRMKFEQPNVVTEDNDANGNKEPSSKYCKKCKKQMSILSTTTKCYHCRSKLIKNLQNGTGIALGVLSTVGAVVASQNSTDASQENKDNDV